MKKKKIKSRKPVKRKPKPKVVIETPPPTEKKVDPNHQAILDRGKLALMDFLSDKDSDVYALGKLHAALDLAEKLKIPKNTTAIEISLAELLITKKSFEKSKNSVELSDLE